ncbi:MAG: hypothetical protein ABIC18_00055, partial [Candidatus Omnitrophota bacterium]
EFKKAQELLDRLEPQGAVIEEKTETKPPQAVVKDKKEAPLTSETENDIGKALAFTKNKESEKAISYYLKAIDAIPDNAGLHYNLAIEYLRTRQFHQATDELHKVIQLNSKDKDAYYNLGILYEIYLGDLERAKFCYNRYIEFAAGADDTNNVKLWIMEIDKKIKLEKERGF